MAVFAALANCITYDWEHGGGGKGCSIRDNVMQIPNRRSLFVLSHYIRPKWNRSNTIKIYLLLFFCTEFNVKIIA